MEVTRLHHSIQAAFNRTIISLFERKLSQSNETKPSRKLNSSSTNILLWEFIVNRPTIAVSNFESERVSRLRDTPPIKSHEY